MSPKKHENISRLFFFFGESLSRAVKLKYMYTCIHVFSYQKIPETPKRPTFTLYSGGLILGTQERDLKLEWKENGAIQ